MRQRAEGMDISAFLGVLRRRVLIIAVAVAAAAIAAYVISEGQPKKYSGTTKLLLQGTGPAASGNPSAPSFSAPLPQSSPDKESIVRQNPVLDRTEAALAKQFGKARAREGVRGLSATAGQDSDVVQLKATASSGTLAAAAANTLARQNIAFRKAQVARKIGRAQRSAERELARLSPDNPNDAQAVSQARQQLSNLRGAAATNEGDATIVQQAGVPSSPSSPKPKRNALIGGFGGLLLGLALALTREQLDRRVRHSKDLEEAFGLPVLANVPKSRVLSGQNGKALEQLPGREAEAFQMLRANLHYLNTDRELRSVVVTSTGIGDGKSTVALNLAKADATVGKRVLLVEADVRRPRLGKLLGLHETEGLTAYLSDRTRSLGDVTARVPVGQARNGEGPRATLDVVAAGPVPNNPSGLIDSERMRELMREAEANYDLVVIDTAPASMVADPIPLMSEATAVVIVGRVGRITSGEADSLREQLERIDAPGYGLVANFVPAGGRYGYGYY
jgi:tyrosine-protein kinase